MLIDLIGYRRFGHNESDEPAYTQPEMYATIKGKKRVWELWADELIAAASSARPRSTRRSPRLGRADAPPPGAEGADRRAARHGVDHEPHRRVPARSHRLARMSRPAVAAELLRDINENLLRVPRRLHGAPQAGPPARAPPRGARARRSTGRTPKRSRRSLLAEGTPIRLTGQDAERGTFSQRHLVLHDADNGQTVSPIAAAPHSRRAVRAAQQPAVGGRLPGLRVRLQPGGSRDARALGGAVRRLRQRRAGDRRPVHRLGAREMGADLAPDAAAAARLRGLGSRALLGAPRALPLSSRPRATCASPTRPPRRSTSTCCAARR